jgi:glutaminyl-peptide cyclotransferase
VPRTLISICASAVLASGLLTGCAAPSGPFSADPAATIRAGLADGVPLLHPRVLAAVAHDTSAWTEGLELAGGRLYEGTGLLGQSQLRELDPGTGRVLRSAPVPAGRYGEGITVLGDRIWQLTYTEHVALPWDRRTLTAGAPVPYPYQGWGLCHTADQRLVASDGSDKLRVLAPADLRLLRTVGVRIAGRPLAALNELDCQPGVVWANVYRTSYLVRIDLTSGAVTAVVDASALVPPSVRADPGTEVLNGIASIPGTDQFLLTGKYWPLLYRVDLGS